MRVLMINYWVFWSRSKDQIQKNKNNVLSQKVQPIKRNSLKSNKKSYKFSLLIKTFSKTVRQLKFLQLQRKNQHKSKKNKKSLLLPKKALIQQDNNINLFLNRQLAYSSLFLIQAISTLCINIHSHITLIFSHNLY